MENLSDILLGALASQEPGRIVLLMGVICAGAFITSAFGIGGGVLMTPLFILLLPAKFAIGLLAPLMFLMSGTAVRQYWRQWDNHNLLVLLPTCLAGIWFGTYLLSAVSGDTVRKTVGVLAIGFGVFQFLLIDRPEWRERLRPPTWQGLCFGLGSGVVSALAHTGGIIFSFYLLPHSRTKESFVATTAFLFFASGLLKLGTYVYFQLLTLPILMSALTMIPALLVGSIMGKRLNRRISARLFMRLIPLIAAVIGVKLILS